MYELLWEMESCYLDRGHCLFVYLVLRLRPIHLQPVKNVIFDLQGAYSTLALSSHFHHKSHNLPFVSRSWCSQPFKPHLIFSPARSPGQRGKRSPGQVFSEQELQRGGSRTQQTCTCASHHYLNTALRLFAQFH